MRSQADSPIEYLSQVSEDRKEAIEKIRATILENLPDKFEETMSYGMIAYVIPHSVYPAGYHCNPKEALPFISFASQKNFIALYHMGVYANPELYKWFIEEYAKRVSSKLDMGKSCIRFKKLDQIPYDLIGELVQKMTADEWIELYEKNYKR